MLGARIAVLRRNAGLSQAEMARILGVSPSTVGMYEQGRRQPAVETLVQLAELFHVSTDFLLTGRVETPQESAVIRQAATMTLADADNRLCKRDHRPFTKEELTVLFAAMLLEG